MKQTLLAAIPVLAILSQSQTLSQISPKSATDIPNADVLTVLKMAQTSGVEVPER